MSFAENLMSKFGYIKDNSTSDKCCEVQIQDGKVIGNPYIDFCNSKIVLSKEGLDFAYKRISCIGTSIDLITNNMQMIEPVFFDDDKREIVQKISNQKLKRINKLFKKPNAIDNRKSFINKAVKNYVLYGVIYFAFVFSKNQPLSIRIIDNSSVNYLTDVTNARIGEYTLQNAGFYNGKYVFNGSYYTREDGTILAPYINPSPDLQYIPCSPLEGTGLETLMYWYGCFHNKSLLQNGARPSLFLLIKSALNPKMREQLREDIRIRHSGSANAGSTVILDGAADKDIKMVGQNNKDLDFANLIEIAENAIYKRLGVNWILGKSVSSANYKIGMEALFDFTISPLFQGLYNHVFDVFKYFNSDFDNLSIYYREQDIPALIHRFLERMQLLPTLGIFTVEERRKMFDYEPLGDFRDDELVVATVKVNQSGMSPEEQNTTEFTGNDNGNNSNK